MQQANAMQIAIEEAKKIVLAELSRSEVSEEELINAEYIIDKFIERLEAKATLPQDDGWISVEDRLPEGREYVLVYSGGCDVASSTGLGHFDDGDFQDDIIATHWQPLPNIPNK